MRRLKRLSCLLLNQPRTKTPPAAETSSSRNEQPQLVALRSTRASRLQQHRQHKYKEPRSTNTPIRLNVTIEP